jgi:TPP-dependent trihydroxycyclohexane-1,2-dione (THcHDO) dehydratase
MPSSSLKPVEGPFSGLLVVDLTHVLNGPFGTAICGESYSTLTHLGKQYSEVATKLSNVPYGEFARMLGGYGEDVRDPDQIQPALRRARESGKCSLINVWVDPEVFSPGTMHQTMYG